MTPSPNSSSSSTDQVEQAVEQDIISGFGFAIGGVVASVILIWIGGSKVSKILKAANG